MLECVLQLLHFSIGVSCNHYHLSFLQAYLWFLGLHSDLSNFSPIGWMLEDNQEIFKILWYYVLNCERIYMENWPSSTHTDNNCGRSSPIWHSKPWVLFHVPSKKHNNIFRYIQIQLNYQNGDGMHLEDHYQSYMYITIFMAISPPQWSKSLDDLVNGVFPLKMG